jgi:homoserine kinase
VADGSWHGDNVWASLMGGGVIVPSTRPADVVPIGSPAELRWVAVHPHFELSTRRARAARPHRVLLGEATSQAGTFGAFIDAWRRGDRAEIGARLRDRLAEPRRARLIPGYERARRAAFQAGAYGFTISGAGPSVIAIAPPGRERRVGKAIMAAFAREDIGSDLMVCAVDARGARRVRSRTISVWAKGMRT